ncbi:hypothetical protein Taro_017071 [Colocasia esculenta]|uniref:Uncharacterized protein n=1 Tax=Colocasia esculenta TaxID=4460 RepID=A0A843UML8_COLES|nr:hypothetical protein [Colocasia esculenta]
MIFLVHMWSLNFTYLFLQIEDIRTKGRDMIQPKAELVREQMAPIRTCAEKMSRKWHSSGENEANGNPIVQQLSKHFLERDAMGFYMAVVAEHYPHWRGGGSDVCWRKAGFVGLEARSSLGEAANGGHGGKSNFIRTCYGYGRQGHIGALPIVKFLKSRGGSMV